MENGDPLVSAEWLLDNFEAPDLRVVDATWFAPFTNPPETGRQVWMRGHIPGAVHFGSTQAGELDQNAVLADRLKDGLGDTETIDTSSEHFDGLRKGGFALESFHHRVDLIRGIRVGGLEGVGVHSQKERCPALEIDTEADFSCGFALNLVQNVRVGIDIQTGLVLREVICQLRITGSDKEIAVC